MNQYIINKDRTIEQDKVFLCDRLLRKKGEIYPVDSLKTIINLNSNDEVSFRIYKYNNGNLNPLWNQLDELSVILVQGKGYFEISVPKTAEDVDYKDISGISLCEAETGQAYVTLEINTENDIARENFIPTVLYNPSKPEASLLHRVFHSMPHYTIGHVDESIANIQKTFSCDNQSVYDFLQEVAEELECIFIFDNFSRTVNCYKSDEYGVDSGVFIDSTENLAENITITGNKDSVKNCFKIVGGDDTITNRIGNRLIGGNYIWMFSPYQLNQMSEPLQEALQARENLVQQYQDNYNSLWDNYNATSDKINYLQSGMMPGAKTDEITSQSVCEEIFGSTDINGKITYACTSNPYQSANMVLKSINNFATLIAPSSYTVELTESSHETDGSDNTVSSISFKAHIYLTGQYEKDENGIDVLIDEYTSDTITLPVKKGFHINYDDNVFTTDYFLYLKQQMEIAEEKSDITDEVITFEPPLNTSDYDSAVTPALYADYDNESNPENLSSIHYTMYCVNRLQSFYDAYESCSQVLAELNSTIAANDNGSVNRLQYIREDGSMGYIYDDLLGKYSKYMEMISARLAFLENKVKDLKQDRDAFDKQIQEIQAACDMQKFLESYENGVYEDSLWKELCSFRRQDTYTNSNYIGEDLEESTLMENVEKLIEQAENEIKKACEIHYSITASIGNLLTLEEFEPFWDKFTLGNYIRIRIDDTIYKLRLISMTFNYEEVEKTEVEFSEFTKSENCVNDLSEILQQAQSVASNFNFVARQAEKGQSANSEMTNIRLNGLDIAATIIKNADNQGFIMDKYGITGRKWNDVQENYEEEQIRLINNLLCFTNDGWKHTCTALGKIQYYDFDNEEYSSAYGLNTEVLIGRMVMSEKLYITNHSGTYVINDNGFQMSKDGKSITLRPDKPSMVITNDDKKLLDFNSDGNGNLIFGEDVKLKWDNIEGVQINENLVYAPNLKAGSVDAEDITGTKISGLTFFSEGIDDNTLRNYNTTITGGNISIVGNSYELLDIDSSENPAIQLTIDTFQLGTSGIGRISNFNILPSSYNLKTKIYDGYTNYDETEINAVKDEIVLQKSEVRATNKKAGKLVLRSDGIYFSEDVTNGDFSRETLINLSLFL